MIFYYFKKIESYDAAQEIVNSIDDFTDSKDLEVFLSNNLFEKVTNEDKIDYQDNKCFFFNITVGDIEYNIYCLFPDQEGIASNPAQDKKLKTIVSKDSKKAQSTGKENKELLSKQESVSKVPKALQKNNISKIPKTTQGIKKPSTTKTIEKKPKTIKGKTKPKETLTKHKKAKVISDTKLYDGTGEKQKKKPRDVDIYSKALERIKIVPFRRTNLLLVNDDMVKMLASWPLLKRTMLVGLEDTGKDESVWDMVQFELEDWGTLSGLGQSVYLYYKTMKDLGLIYPDGTMPEIVARFVDEQADGLSPKEESKELMSLVKKMSTGVRN